MTSVLAERAHWDARTTDEATARLEVWSEDPALYDVRAGQCADLIEPHLAMAGELTAVAEIGCGIGRLTLTLAARWPDVEWHGFDVSPGMVSMAEHAARVAGMGNAKFAVCSGRSLATLRPSAAPPLFDAVFSMVTFQHIPADAVRGYIADAASRLRDGGVLHFQYVVGDLAADFDHRFPMGDVERWCQDAGLDVVAHERGAMYPEWAWVTAVRP